MLQGRPSCFAIVFFMALAVVNPAFALDPLGNPGTGSAGDVSHAPVRTTGDLVLIQSCSSPVQGNDGLAWDGEYLWISDFNTDRAYQVDPVTCLTVRSIPLPGGYPCGLAWDGTHLWYADGDLQSIYELDPADGSIVSSFPSSGTFPTGLTFDGINLWDADTACNSVGCSPDLIHEVTTAGALLNTYAAFGAYPTGFAYDGTNLWHSDNALDAIYKIDPTTFTVLDVYSSPGSYPNDLAWDGTYLWVVDNGTDLLYKYEVEGSSPTQQSTWGRVKARYRE